MMNQRQFEDRCSAIDKGLPAQQNTFFITSTDAQDDGGKPGMVCEVMRENACFLIAKRSHRQSTPEEIEQFHADQKERGRLAMEAEMRNKQQNVVVMSPEAANVMAAAFTGAQSSAMGEQGRARNQKGA